MENALGNQGPSFTDVVSGIWCEVLELPSVGADDNFFDLGGHSILLQTVQRLISTRCGRDVELIDLFNHPTVTSLARFLDSPGTAPGDNGGSNSRGRVRRSSRLGARRAQLNADDSRNS